MSELLHKRIITTKSGRQYSERMARLLVGIAKFGVCFIAELGLITEILRMLESCGCLEILWEDDIAFDIAITEYGLQEAAELEDQGVQHIYLHTEI